MTINYKDIIDDFCFTLLCFVIMLLSFGVVQAQNNAGKLLENARIYKQKKQFATSLDYYIQALQGYTRADNEQQLPVVNYEIGLLYEQWGVNERALDYYLNAYKKAPDVNLSGKIGYVYTQLKNYGQALIYHKKSLNVYKKGNNLREQILVLKQIIDIHNTQKQYNKALDFSLQMKQLQQIDGNQTGVAEAANSIGYFYKFTQQLSKSLESFDEALNFYRKKGNEENVCTILSNQGIIYQLLGDNDRSLQSFAEATKIRQKQKNAAKTAELYNYIAAIFLVTNDLEDAQFYTKKAIELGEQVNNKKSLVISYETMSFIYQKKGANKRALKYFKLHSAAKDSLASQERIKQQASQKKRAEMDKTENKLRLLLVDKEVQELALNKATLEKDKKAKENELLRRDRELLEQTKALQKAKLQQQALEQQKSEQALLLTQQQLNREKQAKKISVLQHQDTIQKLAIREKELKEIEIKKENELLNKNRALQDLKLQNEKQKLQSEQHKRKAREQLYLGIGILLTIIIILVLGNFIMARRTNKKLATQNDQIESQNKLLQVQKEEIESQNQELVQNHEEILTQRDFIAQSNRQLSYQNEKIMASIRYAQTIQQAILPFEEKMQQLFSGHFIIYQPKDVVSGDFYWVSEVNNSIFVAVVDCTGHGVPGAFMSMIGFSMLNDIVSKNLCTNPAQILRRLHKGVEKTLNQKLSDNSDGMDVCLCRIDRSDDSPEVKVTFAGAKRPLVYCHNNQVEVVRGDRICIGGWQHNKQRFFTNHELTLNKNDYLYLSSDGYADTPSPHRKSFSFARLCELIQEHRQVPMGEQQHIFEQAMKNHLQYAEQRDDVTLMGIQV